MPKASKKNSKNSGFECGWFVCVRLYTCVCPSGLRAGVFWVVFGRLETEAGARGP